MIIDLRMAWETETGQIGQIENYRINGGEETAAMYKSMGSPNGGGRDGLEAFIETMLKGLVAQGGAGAGTMSLFGPGLNVVPGYKPWVKARILGDSERDVAPLGALPAYAPRLELGNLEKIAAAAPVNEEGQKIAYVAMICEFWATSLDDCDPCPKGECAAHCPHCGSTLIATPLEDALEIWKGREAYGVATYGPNTPDRCHLMPHMYHDEIRRIFDAMKNEAKTKALPQKEPGRYAHIIEGYEKLADRDCQKCGQAAKPVALCAREKSGQGAAAKWLLTWDCGARHYDVKKPGAIAPWPFLEEYATPADLVAAGFKVVGV